MPVQPTTGVPAELPIQLDRSGEVPLAAQLADSLRTAATEGPLRPGDRLPSTRSLARRLGVSRTVTAAAYEQLHAEGWISGRRGSGTYVTTTPPKGRSQPPADARPDEDEAGMIDLTPGAPWTGGLDRAAWRRAWRAAAEAEPLQRPCRPGLPEYHEVIAEHLLRHRGLAVGASGAPAGPVLATSGTTAAVAELVSAVLAPSEAMPGRWRGESRRGSHPNEHSGSDQPVVAMEEPGYQRAVGSLRAAGLRVLPVPVDHQGIVVDAIPAGVRAVYCSPAHQYPIGGRLPAERRVELVRRARAENWLVIEDDYDGELRYDVAPLPLLASLAPDVVVHLGTMSKILTPTLGVGWMVAPTDVVATVLRHREHSGTGPAPAGQRVLVELARHGDLGRHLRRLRRELAQRRSMVVHRLSEAGVPLVGDQAGAHLMLPLPDGAAERRVIAEGRRAGLRLDGLARHHVGDPRWFGIALGYASCARDELLGALPSLVELLAQ